MENNQRSEFINLQFIRNPAIGTTYNNLKYVAFDYFDYIYVKKADTFYQCMSTENSFSCDAYQNLSIFRTAADTASSFQGSPFEENNDMPFLSIMQITITPETFNTFNICNSESEFDHTQLNDCENELNENIGTVISQEFEKHKDLKLKYQIYKSVNTMDFCIAVSCNMLELPLHLSNKINSLKTEGNSKYVVYTVMGIDKNFTSNSQQIIINDSILVTRIRLSKKLWSNKGALETLLLHLKNGNNESHMLIGKYDLSFRVTGNNNIITTLEKQISYKINGNKNNENITEPKLYENTNTDDGWLDSAALIAWLLDNNYVDYINERILFNKCVPPIELDDKPSQDYEGTENLCLSKCYDDLQETIKKFPIKKDIEEYMKKLKNMIHICIGLRSTYDTQINIIMFQQYILAFMKLFLLACEAIAETNIDEDWINIKLNFIEGLNYLQQFIKIVTSINGNSFQAPKYDIVQQECSIEKFPIAYSEFLSEMCNKYYEHRKQLNDDEFKYYPKYQALMIPFMTSTPSDFTMTILFSQGISHNWDTEKVLWEKWINNSGYKVPIYVTCQNLQTYLDVSGVIVASFHELGHYCNTVTRKTRNETILKIAASIASKSIVKAYLYNSAILMPIQMKMLRINNQFNEFNDIVYNALLNNLLYCMESDMSSPNILFMEKLSTAIHNILKPMPPYHTEIDLQKKYINYLQDDLKFKYHINIKFSENPDTTYSSDMHENFLKREYEELYIISDNKIQKLKNDIKANKILITNDLENYFNNTLTFLKTIKDNIKQFLFSENTDIDNLYNDIASSYHSIKNDNSVDSLILTAVEDLRKIIKYILKSREDWSIICVNDNDQSQLNDKIIEKKTKAKVINDIMENIPNLIKAEKYFYETLSADLNNKLFFRSDVTLVKLKETLYDSFMKAEFNEDELDVWQINYTESLADIVMCVNLNLDILEYLIFISPIYCQYNSFSQEKIRRIILVINYLYATGNFDNSFDDFIQYLSEKKEIKTIINKYNDPELKLNCYEKYIYQIYHDIEINSYIVKNTTYQAILSSLLENCGNIKFLDKEQIRNLNFVKDYLKKKLSENSFDEKIQEKEISFILKYYYKTRTNYMKLKQK